MSVLKLRYIAMISCLLVISFISSNASAQEPDYQVFLPLISSPTPPEPFDKYSPADGATDQDLELGLWWVSSENVTYYEYCIDSSDDNSCTDWISTGLNNYGVPPQLAPNTTYYWQVRAWNGSVGPTYANGDPHSFWTFTTLDLNPAPFEKFSPVDGATDQDLVLGLWWVPSERATNYEYCMDTTNDNACSNWISTGADNYVVPPELTSYTTYYWQVRAWNEGVGPTYANGSPTAFWSLRTKDVFPSPFTKFSPQDGAINQDVVVGLWWVPAERVTNYEYCIDTSNDNICSNWISTGINNYAIPPQLTPSTTYYWQVRAWNGTHGPTYANGSSSANWSFRTLDPGVHVLDNCSMYATTNAYVHLVCEIYNNTSSNVENVKLYIDIYNSLGGLVDTDEAYAPIDIIHIREKACIDISFPRPSDPNFYVELGGLSWSDTSGSRPSLSLSNHSGNAGGSFYTVLGILTNNLSQSVYSVKAVDSLYSSSGYIIGCDYEFINKDPHDLSPGQSSSFEITTSLPDPSSVVRYAIQTNGSLLGTASEQATTGEEHIVSLSKIYHLMDLQLLIEEAENSFGERGLGE